MKKKLFYLNLNGVHGAGERSMHSYNFDRVDWYKTPISPEVSSHFESINLNNYINYMSANETAKPFFDYYYQYRKFDLSAIEELYSEIGMKVDHIRFFQILANIDKVIEYVKELNPDIIFMRFYTYYEFFSFYFFDKIKDLSAFKAMGGSNLDFDNWHYIDKMLDDGLINNFHDGYGEKHLSNILDDPSSIPQKTLDHNYIIDDFSIPESDIHWITTTLRYNGNCKFCVHNRAARGLIKSEVILTSDDYIDFITDRLKYFQKQGVVQTFIPGSLTFYNITHLEKFYEAFMSKDIKMLFVDSFFKFEDITSDTLTMLEDMNFHSIKLGLESIHEPTRRIVGKTYTNEYAEDVTRLLTERGMRFKYSFLFNLPFTDYAEMISNLKFIEKWDLRYYSFNRYTMYNDTEINLNPADYNLIEKTNEFGYKYYQRMDSEKFSTKMFKIIENKVFDRLYSEAGIESKRMYYNNYIKLG